MTTATTKQIATINKLLTHRQHTDNGKTILIGETRFRTTAEKIDTISKTVASRMIDALLQAPELESPKAPAQPHFTMGLSKSWVVANPEAGWDQGDIVEVRTASGETRRVELLMKDKVAMEGSPKAAQYQTVTAWTFRDAPEEATQATEQAEDTETPAKQPPKPRATGWSTARGHRDYCPVCGEPEGDMYNWGLCDECGYVHPRAEDWAEEKADMDAAETAYFKRREERAAKEEAKQSTLAEVAAAFDALREAETDTEELSAKATEVINRAQEEGEDIVRIAEAAGINRNNVYKRLKAGAPSVTVVTRDVGEITGTSLEAAILRTYGPRARATKHADPNAPTWGMVTARTALDRNAAHVLDEIISVDGRYN